MSSSLEEDDAEFPTQNNQHDWDMKALLAPLELSGDDELDDYVDDEGAAPPPKELPEYILESLGTGYREYYIDSSRGSILSKRYIPWFVRFLAYVHDGTDRRRPAGVELFYSTETDSIALHIEGSRSMLHVLSSVTREDIPVLTWMDNQPITSRKERFVLPGLILVLPLSLCRTIRPIDALLSLEWSVGDCCVFKIVQLFKIESDSVAQWRLCYGCGASSAYGTFHMRCSRCKFAFYCSKECQIQQWGLHKKICKVLENGLTSLEKELDSSN
jgi:hypothetical protein